MTDKVTGKMFLANNQTEEFEIDCETLIEAVAVSDGAPVNDVALIFKTFDGNEVTLHITNSYVTVTIGGKRF